MYQNIKVLTLDDSQAPWWFRFVFFQCNNNPISTNK